MVRNSHTALRRGLTLIELVVVIAILAVLAAMVVPRLDFLKTQSEHASSASTQADLGAMIQTFKASSGYYPTLDLLVDDSGTLYSKLQSQTTGAFLEPWTVPAAGGPPNGSWYRSITEGGFRNGYRHSTTATNASSSGTAPADIFNQAATGSLVLATIKSTGGDASQLGNAIRMAIYPGIATYVPGSDGPDNLPGTTDDVAATTTTTGAGEVPADKKLVVMGIGPRTSLLSKVMVSAPTSAMTVDDAAATYCRYLAVFEVNQNGNAASLKMITDHRGRQIGARIDQYKATSAVN